MSYEPTVRLVKRREVAPNVRDKVDADQLKFQGEIPPPYNPEYLATAFDQSNILRQCTESMVTNTTKYGYVAVARYEDIPVNDDEKEILESYIDTANDLQSLTAVMAQFVFDKLRMGYGFLEIVRDSTGIPQFLRHIPSYYTRLWHKDPTPVPVKIKVARGKRVITLNMTKFFRRYVYRVHGREVWYKEFGDPRKMDYRNGKYEIPNDPAQGNYGYEVEPQYEATEILHLGNQSDDEYGVPIWIGQVASVVGSRQAEETNLDYFEANTVPPILLSVAGGRLTNQCFQDLERLINEGGIGKDRQNRMLLVEAIPDSQSLDGNGGTVTLKVDKLADARPDDGLFTEYDKANRAKVRSSFRLPPGLIGESEDVTFACYDDKTETLTDRGWVTLDQWQDGTKVASYNPDSGEITYSEPDGGLLVYDVAGIEMYRIQTQQQDLCVTPNHRMLVASKKDGLYQIEKIEDLTDRSRAYFRTSGVFAGGKRQDTFSVPASEYNGGIAAQDPDIGTMSMDLLLEWLGYYLADGSLVQRGCGVRIGAKKEHKVARFADLHDHLEDCGFRVRAADESAGIYFNVSHKGFAGWLGAEAGHGSSSKRIPEFVWDLPADQLQILFDALMFCDGSWDSRHGRSSGAYSTVSGKLADDFQRLAVLLGYRALLRQDRPGGYGLNTVYRILLSEKDTCIVEPEKHITRELYEGKVYCFSVPTGVFITRRNGKVAFQGNTANVAQWIAEMQVFSVYRRDLDEMLNKYLVNNPGALGLQTVKLKSLGPNIANPEVVIRSLQALNIMGGMTPRKAVEIANEILQLDMPQYPEEGEEGWEEWMDKPMPVFTAEQSRRPEHKDQDQQRLKNERDKEVEDTGDPSEQEPENGDE